MALHRLRGPTAALALAACTPAGLDPVVTAGSTTDGTTGPTAPTSGVTEGASETTAGPGSTTAGPETTEDLPPDGTSTNTGPSTGDGVSASSSGTTSDSLDTTGAGSSGTGTGDGTTGDDTTGDGTTGDDTTGDDTVGPNPDPVTACELPWQETSSVVGTTPAGAFDGRFAGFGFTDDCAGNLVLELIESPAPTLDGVLAVPHRVEVDIWSWSDETKSWVGDGEASARLYVDGEVIEMPGSGVAEITAAEMPPFGAEPFELTGTLTIDGPGWSLSGPFSASYCGAFTQFCP